MFSQKNTAVIGWAFAIGTVVVSLISCDESGVKPKLYEADPQIAINHDSAATNDTLLRVYNRGSEKYSDMEYSTDPHLTGALWVDRDSVFQIAVPRVEGTVSVYARFASPCCTTGIANDSIRLDFITRIESLYSAAVNPLRPGDKIKFTLLTAEEGTAEVAFGKVVTHFPLPYAGVGRYTGTLEILNGMTEDSVSPIGYFTDAAGNVAAPYTGTTVYKIEGPALEPVKVGTAPSPVSGGNDVVATETNCFISYGHAEAITSYDSRNPKAPVLLRNGVLETAGWTFGMAEDAGLLVVAYGTHGLLFVQSGGDMVGSYAGTLPIDGSPRDVTIAYPYVYTATIFGGLKVLRITEHNLPGQISELKTTYSGLQIAVADEIVYTVGNGGLTVISVADPMHPELISELPLYSATDGLCYLDGKLYVAQGKNEVDVIDVSDPKHPQQLPSPAYFTNIRGFALSSPYLFVSEENQITILDALDDKLPVVDKITGLNQAEAITIRDRWLYVATGDGLDIYRLYGE